MKKFILLLIALLLCFSTCDFGADKYINFTTPDGVIQVVFSVASDMRDYTGCNPDHFRGVCETIREGGRSDFMVSAGDFDPPQKTYSTIQEYIDQNYKWYPVVGNHELESSSYMEWLRGYNSGGFKLPNIVKTGPPGCKETTYSFDYGTAHFIILNEYCDGISDSGTDGDIVNALYNWLMDDLEANSKPIIFVFGHEPAYPMPDAESVRLRHTKDSLNKYENNSDRFWNTLSSYGVIAYICGHTHNYSAVKINGVWQIDSGHARGTGDTGSRSTFIMIYVMEDQSVWYYTYRLDLSKGEYALTDYARMR
ncbi:MAG: metallophosphoesterase family protein [Spirochaetota bacterium]